MNDDATPKPATKTDKPQAESKVTGRSDSMAPLNDSTEASAKTEPNNAVSPQVASSTASKTKPKEPLEGDDLQYINKLIELLTEQNVDKAKSWIRDKKNAAVVTRTIWSIIPLLTKHVNTESMGDTQALYEACIKMLKNVSKIADPEDLVLCLLQELQQATDDELFLSLLKPLQTSLIRLPKKRIKFVGWSLHAMWRYLMKLPAPDNYAFEYEEEKMLMDADPVVNRISSTYFESLPFYDPFIEEYKKCKNKEQLEIKNLLIRYMTNSLDKPFAFLDLEVRSNTKSRARRVAEKLVENVTKLMPDIYTFLEFRTDRNDTKLIRDLALGVFFYLCLCENIHYEKAPKIYHPIYVFQNALYFCVAMLKANSQFSVERGLTFTKYLFDSVKDYVLDYQLLDATAHSRFCRVITTLCVTNPMTQIRTRSLHAFNTYLHLFDTKGRYLIILNLGQLLTSPNVKAYLIGLYKEMFHQEFLKNEHNVSPYFRGYKLLTLLKLFCFLQQKEESDLIDMADQIIACLNLVRYMVLRDKKNISNIWDYVPELDRIFLDPLKKGILLSKVHYEARIKDVEKEKGGGDKKSVVSVTVNDKTDLQDNMSVEEKVRVLQAAITTFDVMDSILCSLNEDIAKGI